jgi:DNA-binding transcriptional MocR family regulator
MRRIAAPSLIRLLGLWRAPGRGPAHRQLVETLRLLILDGRLPLGLRLPGERELAAALGLSRTTVSAAYNGLRDAGFLISRHGSGSVTSIPGRAAADRAEDDAPGSGAALLEMSVASMPANESVHRAYATALAGLPAYLPASGYEAVGLPELREVVAARYAELGVPTAPDQILITQGAQQGLVILLRALAGPGDRVVVDLPTYPLALDAIQRASCRVVPVPLPETGWDAEALAAAFHQTAPRLAYLQPDFHNPTGQVMDAETRAKVVAAAARSRTLVVSDETMADLWLEGRRPPPLAGFDQAGLVVSLGSTGKTFWGGLRIGWIRGEAQLIAALARVRASLDMGSPILEQLAAAALLSEGEQALDARREVLRARRDHLLDSAAEHVPDWRLTRPRGGLSIWAELPRPASTLLAAAAESRGVRLASGTRFGVDGAFERFVRLPYALPEERLTMVVERLAAAWNALSRGFSRASASPARIPALEAVI